MKFKATQVGDSRLGHYRFPISGKPEIGWTQPSLRRLRKLACAAGVFLFAP
jgi:hypothetical protein